YAWIAAGRFDPSIVEIPELGTGEQDQDRLRGIGIARELGTNSLLPLLERIALNPEESAATRVAATAALGSFNAEASFPFLVTILSDQEQPVSMRDAAAIVLARSESQAAITILRETIATAAR